MLALTLRANAYEVAVATTSNKDWKAALSLQPDVVISDVVMPKMNGIELATRMSKETQPPRILLFSDHATTTDLLRPSSGQRLQLRGENMILLFGAK